VLTATQASRGFADVLERARAGESFSVTKNGRPLARILPPEPPKPNGAAVLAALGEWEEEFAGTESGFTDELVAYIDSFAELNERDLEHWADLEQMWRGE